MWSRIYEFFWRMLPDKCEMPDCCRQGVRGNENIVGGKVMCDYCHAAMLRSEDAAWPAARKVR